MGALVRGIVKVLALVVGAFATVVSLMALAGIYTQRGWAQAGIAIAVAVLVPLLLADRVLGMVAKEKQNGVTTDVLAVLYMTFALVFAVVAHAKTAPLLRAEGHRLAKAGLPRTAQVAMVLAGGGAGSTVEVPVAPGPGQKLVDQPPKPVVVADAGSAAPKEAVAKDGGLRAGDGKERTPAQLFAEFAPSVVTIHVKGDRGEGGGTGFIIDDAGTIATNEHVIQDMTEIDVKLMDGTMADTVEVLVENESGDLALLHITAKAKLTPVVLGDSDAVTVGERAVSIGNPLGLEHTLTDGLVSARRMIEGRKMIQMSTPVSPGNSGGPLFNSRGEVVGITTAVYLGGSLLGQNLNLATPINDVKPMLKSEYPGRHKVGEMSSSTGGRW